MSKHTPLLICTTLCTGLSAGLFFAYSCSVIPGLGNLDDAAYLAAMQSINREIQNPVFFSVFFGAQILLIILLGKYYKSKQALLLKPLLAATILYTVGVIGVTLLGNVPLNNMLEQFDIASASASSMATLRRSFEQQWNALNHVRSVCSGLSLLLLLLCLRILK